jgi:5-formyltetrahydrofolate cyclo-ligase
VRPLCAVSFGFEMDRRLAHRTLPGAVSPSKEALRERMRAVRSAIPEWARRSLGARVEERLFALPEIGSAGTVLLYDAFGTEVPTDPIAARLRAAGTRVLLPVLREGSMEAAEAGDGSALVPTAYGPREPRDAVTIDAVEVDVVIAPGLAFDRSGARLGYGGGRFDRYLARMRPGARRVGIAFHAQLVDRVPADAGDEPVDLVVTDAETVACAPGRII